MKTTHTLHLLLCCFLLISSNLLNAQCHIDDWTALKALYESTDGDNWLNNDGWESVKNEEPSADCYLENLFGITLDASGRVISVTLNKNELEGSLPPELGLLSNLEYLSLSKNRRVVGNIPSELGNLFNLIMLNFYSNGLNGSIPPELSSLSKLKELNLSYNNLIGSIPHELNQLTNLEILHLNANNLIGSIPSELGDLTNLNDLKLYSNQLRDSIPQELGKLTLLSVLELQRNNLNGNIPAELSNLINLKILYLHDNKLNGSIPPEFVNLDKLIDLQLSYNLLSGHIPVQLSSLTNLTNLDLSINDLTGSIPSELGKLNKLTNLDLSYNKLNGHIPFQLSNLIKLEHLNLSYNNLNGSIPPELGELVNLDYLGLAYNQISGNIPPELGNLPLISLDLSRNQLTGNIPMEISKITELRLLNLRSNQLSGTIPPQISDLKYLGVLNLRSNQLSGDIPFLSFFDSSTHYEFDIANNNFTCNDIESFIYENSTFKYQSFSFWYSPQNYTIIGKQSFNIDNPFELILLIAPINQTGNFTYQWHKNEKPVKSATDSILILNNVQFEDVGNYTLHIYDHDCVLVPLDGFDDFHENLEYISDPISVRRTDLEGCTDINSCNYNEFAFIDDGSCEYLWCDTMTNPIRIRTDNETILSETQIKFDIVIDSLDLEYSADGLTFTLDTRGNYRIESIEVINPSLSKTEVDISQLYNSTISINRINKQRLASNEPIISVTGCIVVDEIPTDESSCSYFAISGGTKLASGHFIDFDNIYIDIPFSNCSPYGDFGAEGENWLPMVLTINPQNCQTETAGLIEIKILQEGLSPFAYILKNEEGAVVLEATSEEKRIDITELNAGNYELTVFDMEGKKTTLNTCIPLVANLNGNVTCQNNCIDYVVVPDGELSGIHKAKKEIEIKGFVNKTETVEFNICD